MSTFRDREKAFEDKYKHDQELQFKVDMRRNKLLGLFIAELLDLKGEEAEAYAKQVVSADLKEPGHADVVRKVMEDLEAKGVDFSEHRLEKKMAELLELAKQQVMSE